MRIDVWLVENKLAPSRQKAQDWVNAGRVFIVTPDGVAKRISKASVTIDTASVANGEVKIEVRRESGPDYVSRGGIKMRGALDQTKLNVTGFHVFDIGISTGGFSDCCLQAGAARVVGVDVGHGQLAEKLRNDDRVAHLEGVNARMLVSPSAAQPVIDANDGRRFDLVVIDVSFISLKYILPVVPRFLAPGGHVIALVKPQFEVGRAGLSKKGIVKDAALFPVVESSIKDVCASLGLAVESYFGSSILGSDGNQEFFLHAKSPELGFSFERS